MKRGRRRDSDIPEPSLRALRLWALLPHAVFLLLWLVTFRRWVLPFADSGREMNTAWRVASGEALYRDVGWSYGPLAPLVDAALLRVFGRNLDVLVAWRTLLGVLGVELLRRLARRLAADAASASAITAFAVAACAFGVGGSWPFPYSAAALAGMVLTWASLERALTSEGAWASAAAGLLAGLACACKVEILPAALPALVLALLARRGWRETAGAAALACGVAGVAYGLPVARYGVALMRRQGFLIALDVPEAWRRVYERHVVFGDMSRSEFLDGRFVEIFMPSALFLGALFFLARRRSLDGPAAPSCSFAAAAATVVPWPENQALHALLPGALALSLAALGAGLVRLVRGDRSGSERAALAAATLPPLLRQPFFLRNLVYGAFSAPLALVTALGWASRRVAARRAFLAAVLGLAAAQAAHRWWGIGRVPLALTKLPGLTAYLVPMEARLLEQAAAEIEKRVPPRGAVARLPGAGHGPLRHGPAEPVRGRALPPGRPGRGGGGRDDPAPLDGSPGARPRDEPRVRRVRRRPARARRPRPLLRGAERALRPRRANRRRPDDGAPRIRGDRLRAAARGGATDAIRTEDAVGVLLRSARPRSP